MRALWMVVAMGWVGVMPALGCLNDTQTERGEADFRARYGEGETGAVGRWTVWGVDGRGMAAVIVGTGLMTGLIVSRRGRGNSKEGNVDA